MGVGGTWGPWVCGVMGSWLCGMWVPECVRCGVPGCVRDHGHVGRHGVPGCVRDMGSWTAAPWCQQCICPQDPEVTLICTRPGPFRRTTSTFSPNLSHLYCHIFSVAGTAHQVCAQAPDVQGWSAAVTISAPEIGASLPALSTCFELCLAGARVQAAPTRFQKEQEDSEERPSVSTSGLA